MLSLQEDVMKNEKKNIPAKKKTSPKANLKRAAGKVKRSVARSRKIAVPATQDLRVIGLELLSVPPGAHKPKKLLGRGPSSGHGKTSTRGSKGQTSRAGRHFYAGFEGGQTPLIRRIPKRGFTNRFKKEFQIVNLKDLAGIKVAVITPEILQTRNLIKDQFKLIKILGTGEIKNAFKVTAHAFSKRAQEAIIAAGGKIEIINVQRAS